MLQAFIAPIASLIGTFVEGRVAKTKAKAQAKVVKAKAEADAPAWYQYAMYASIAASFGIRSIRGFKK
jgi:hypothetical protein